jgi:serine/threonine-protein kinase
LRFIVEETLAGRSNGLKEYTLGVDAFDRGEDFDPRLNPIVRIEAGRLRSRLKQYYAGEGRRDEIQIYLPRGTYTPVFRKADGGQRVGVTEQAESRRAFRPKPQYNGIAVLPFADQSSGQNQAYLCDGITEEVIHLLSRVSGLRVIVWPSVLRFKARSMDVRDVRDLLHVEMALSGSVRKSQNRVRVIAQLIDLLEDEYRWSEVYNRELSDVFEIQQQIAQAIVRTFQDQFPAGHVVGNSRRHSGDLQAYKLYLRGRYYWNDRSEQGLRRAVQYFEQAIAEDSNYALAWTGLADCYALIGFYGTVAPSEYRIKANKAALRAVEIDPDLAEAHASLAFITTIFEWDWAAAEREFQVAIGLNPGYATAHHWYAIAHLAPRARFDEAMVEIQRAHEFDPISLAINRDLAMIHYYSRRYDLVEEQARKTVALEPTFPAGYWLLGLADEQRGMFREATEAFENGLSLSGGASSNSQMAGALAHTYGLWGKRRQALNLLAQLLSLSQRRYVCPFDIAVIYMGLSDIEQAFTWLAALYEVRSYELTRLRVDPRCDVLRGDTRFTKLLMEVGLLG